LKLALDHHYSLAIARELRARGHDVVAAIERGWETEDDETLLSLCHDEQRALLTNNVGDFVPITRRWAIEDRQHAGLLFTSDSAMPRSRRTIGRFVAALHELMTANADATSFVDRVAWL
jgi:uncharacterized protein with PIN domain